MFSPRMLRSLTSARGLLHPSFSHARPLVTQPSVSEVTEALDHVKEAENKLNSAPSEEPPVKKQPSVPKLDRERDMKLTYSIVGPDRFKIVNSLLYATYHPDEPITKHLGLFKGPDSIPDADRNVQLMLLKHLSMFAFDSSGEIVGVCVNNAHFRSEFLDMENGLDQVLDPAYRPMLDIHHALRMKNKHIYDELRTEKFFSIRMVGVDPKTRGMGVATDLIRRSILLAGCLGFTGVKTYATGKFSKKAFATVGMLQTNSINYSEYEFEGKKVFEGMDPNHTELAFMKKKFFQSCLKHIM
eukprot:GFUD01041077.1.p1 GENE.GFUD01041077.1~~GFUD01041077.1.p1  ORF type:complete len:299 (+),score=60.64 GFUD01041077.1:75-971(+)